MTKGIQLSHQENVRTLAEKETSTCEYSNHALSND